jgi:glycosyltransferase involved in cell wall biosynthesis
LFKKPFILAAIPAYNEEGTIARVITQSKRYANRVIVCDDGSSDATGNVAKQSGATVVRHNNNSGYGAALSTLFKEARKLDPDAVVVLDADGQHDPACIPKLIEPILENGADIVIGSRFLNGDCKDILPVYRKVGISIITKLTSRASYNGITDAQSGLRAYSRDALQAIYPTQHGMGASTEILIRAKEANLKVVERPVLISYEGRTSKENPLTHSFKVILTTLGLIARLNPQIFYGTPSLLAMVLAILLWTGAGMAYNATGNIAPRLASAAIGATIIGLVLLSMTVIQERRLRAELDVSAREHQDYLVLNDEDRTQRN